MSDKNTIPDSFDFWLSKTLKKDLMVVDPVFTQTLLRRVDRLTAQKFLRKVVWQERIARALLILASLALLAALCCPPVLRCVYACFEAALKSFIASIMEPSPSILVAAVVLAIFILGALFKSIWYNLIAE